MATVLEIVQAAADELGLTRPAAVWASTAAGERQFAALLNRIGIEVMKAKDDGWTMLQTEYDLEIGAPITKTSGIVNGSTTVTVADTSDLEATIYAVSGTGMQTGARVASITNATTLELTEEATATGSVELTFAKDTFPIPDDFDRYVNRTMWDRTQHWELMGPMSPQNDQWQRSGIVALGPRRRWRQIGYRPNVFRLFPPPISTDAPALISFEYVSNAWAVSATGLRKSKTNSDSDEVLFSENVMVRGLKAAFFATKGFGAGRLQAEYADALSAEMAADGGAGTLGLGRRRLPVLLSAANVQDGNFPS